MEPEVVIDVEGGVANIRYITADITVQVFDWDCTDDEGEPESHTVTGPVGVGAEP